jgi:hypothetical protein
VTKGGGITVTVLMTSIDAKNRVADRLNSGCLGDGPDIVDIRGEAVGEAIEENIDAQGVEVEVKGLELTVLGLDLIDPFRD